MNHARAAKRAVWCSLLALAAVVGGGGALFLQHLDDLPAVSLDLPPAPRHNGYEEAVRTVGLTPAMAAVATQAGIPPTWKPGWDALLPQAVLARVRSSLRRPWRVPPVPQPGRTVPEKGRLLLCAEDFLSQGVHAAGRGDHGAALACDLDALELAALSQTGDCFAGRKAAVAIHARAILLAPRWVERAPEAAIPAALVRVRRIRSEWSPVEETVRAERASTLQGVVEALQGVRRLPWVERPSMARASARGGGFLGLEGLTPPRVALQNVDAYYRQLLAESRKLPRARRPVPVPTDAWSSTFFGAEPIEDLVEVMLPVNDLALLEAALATRLYFLRFGRYPERLEEIDAEWLPSVPRDLWDQPIHYRIAAGRPVLYSLYQDGADDGGRPIDPARPTALARGDLVWGRLTRYPPMTPRAAGR